MSCIVILEFTQLYSRCSEGGVRLALSGGTWRCSDKSNDVQDLEAYNSLVVLVTFFVI